MMQHKEGHMIVPPTQLGWVRQGETRIWTKPDGSLYTFPPNVPMLVHQEKPSREHLKGMAMPGTKASVEKTDEAEDQSPA